LSYPESGSRRTGSTAEGAHGRLGIDKDLRALIQAVEEGRSTDSEAEPGTDLPSGVLEALRTLVLCDDVTFLELAPTGCDIGHRQA
jgi:hypothetical protein